MRRPPRFTRTDTLFACTARFRSGRGPDRCPVPFTPGAEPGGDGIGAVEVSRGVRRRAGEDDAVVDQDHLVTDTRTGHGAGTASSEEPTPSPRPGLSGSRRALIMTARVERRAPAWPPARPAGPSPTRGATGPDAHARAVPPRRPRRRTRPRPAAARPTARRVGPRMTPAPTCPPARSEEHQSDLQS